MVQGVYELVFRDNNELCDKRIFGYRMVYKVKGKETSMPYKKLRSVVQTNYDHGKKKILTQSPTIQRVSQRIIVSSVEIMEFRDESGDA